MPTSQAPRNKTPLFVQRKVVAFIQRRMREATRKGTAYVPTRKDLSFAFATAISQAQDQGWLEPGSSTRMTARGRAEAMRRKEDPRAPYKDAIYAWCLKVSRYGAELATMRGEARTMKKKAAVARVPRTRASRGHETYREAA